MHKKSVLKSDWVCREIRWLCMWGESVFAMSVFIFSIEHMLFFFSIIPQLIRARKLLANRMEFGGEIPWNDPKTCVLESWSISYVAQLLASPAARNTTHPTSNGILLAHIFFCDAKHPAYLLSLITGWKSIVFSLSTSRQTNGCSLLVRQHLT